MSATTIKAKVYAYNDVNGIPRRIAVLEGKTLKQIIQELEQIQEQILKAGGVYNDFTEETIIGDCLEKYGYKIL